MLPTAFPADENVAHLGSETRTSCLSTLGLTGGLSTLFLACSCWLDAS